MSVLALEQKMSDSDRLTEQQRREILDRQIVPVTLDGVDPAAFPRAILVGGQPGSGKSQLLRLAANELGPGSSVTINGDELRYFHPLYDSFVTEDELSMPDRTSPEVSFWVEQLISIAIRRRLNIIIEGTFRRPSVTMGTVTDLVKGEYQVDAWAVALHEWASRLGVITRYLEMKRGMGWGRWSPRTAHDTSYHAMSSTLLSLESSRSLDSLSVRRRDGTTLARFEGSVQVEGLPQYYASAAAALVTERTRSWSELEFNEFLEDISRAERLSSEVEVPTEVFLEIANLVSDVVELIGPWRST